MYAELFLFKMLCQYVFALCIDFIVCDKTNEVEESLIRAPRGTGGHSKCSVNFIHYSVKQLCLESPTHENCFKKVFMGKENFRCMKLTGLWDFQYKNTLKRQ